MNDAANLNDVRDALNFLDCNVRDVWVMAALAIKDEFGEEGFEAWINWSEGYDKFKISDARAVWRSAKCGATGIGSLFHAAINNGYKPAGYTDEEKKQFAREQAQRKVRLDKQRVIDAGKEAAIAEQVARAASEIVNKHCKPVGKSLYLAHKKIGPNGALFPKYGFLFVLNEEAATVTLIHGKQAVNDFFKSDKDHLHFLYIKPGHVIIPLVNKDMQIRSLQVIFSDASNNFKKRFLKGGGKSGLFHILNPLIVDGPVVLCEGFSTGASIAEATGYTVVLAFDSGNLTNVAACIAFIFAGRTFIVAGDDDVELDVNTGRIKAWAAAKILGCSAVFPVFSEVAA